MVVSARKYRTFLVYSAACLLVACLVAACGGGSSQSADVPEPQVLAAIPGGNIVLFGYSSTWVTEDQRSVRIPVVRSGDGVGPASVKFTGTDGTASAGEDYQVEAGTLFWADGQTGARYIQVHLYSDTHDEGSEFFELELSNLAGADSLGPRIGLQVEIKNSNCSGTLGGSVVSGSLEGVVTLSQGCYQMRESVTVGHGASLILNEGSTIVAHAGTKLLVTSGGSIQSHGSVTLPVEIKGSQSVPGHWQGIELFDADAFDNGFTGTIIRDANIGITGNEFSRLGTFSGNQIVGNYAGPLKLSAHLISVLDPSSSYSGNSSDYVIITGGSIDDNVLWSSLDVPYLTQGTLVVNGRLSVQAGTELYFAADQYLLVSAFGVLRAIGTAQAPVVFSGRQSIPGFWDGLHFLATTNADNVLDYTEVSYAGGHVSYPANIALYGGDALVSVTNSTISYSSTHGIWANGVNSIVSTSNNNYVGNQGEDLRLD